MMSRTISITDIPYLRHGDQELLATIYRPAGSGPFPAVIDLHGGTWCMGDRAGDEAIARALAERGIVVASLDFRDPPGGEYPASVADVNFGVRWLKELAAELGSLPAMVGALGASSGGHLALLNALKPRDPRYASIASEGDADAAVSYVVALWPVLCPARRHAYLREREATEPTTGGWPTANMIAHEDLYWGSDEAMAEGSPLLALERGDSVELPDVLIVQSTGDEPHPRSMLEAFAEAYERRGGRLDLELVESNRYDQVRVDPTAPESVRAIDRIAAFVHDRAGG